MKRIALLKVGAGEDIFPAERRAAQVEAAKDREPAGEREGRRLAPALTLCAGKCHCRSIGCAGARRRPSFRLRNQPPSDPRTTRQDPGKPAPATRSPSSSATAPTPSGSSAPGVPASRRCTSTPRLTRAARRSTRRSPMPSASTRSSLSASRDSCGSSPPTSSRRSRAASSTSTPRCFRRSPAPTRCATRSSGARGSPARPCTSPTKKSTTARSVLQEAVPILSRRRRGHAARADQGGRAPALPRGDPAHRRRRVQIEGRRVVIEPKE